MILAQIQGLVAIIGNLFGTLLCFFFFWCRCARLIFLHFVIVLSELLKFHYKYTGM